MFRRRTTTGSSSIASDAAALATAEPAPAKQGGKGRPTPKRREAERGRKTIGAPPKNRKEAAKGHRQAMRAQRIKARESMASGSDEFLPARDKGPVRRYARDFIDSRRSIAEYFLLGAFVIFLLSSFGGRQPSLVLASSLAFYGLLLLIIVDSTILSRRLKREVRTHFPDASTKGLTAYAVMRSLQFRRLRMPAAQVNRGETVIPQPRRR